MLDQFSRNGTLPRDASSPAAGFPANIERDMDLLLSLLGQSQKFEQDAAVDLLSRTNIKLQSRTLQTLGQKRSNT